MTHMTRACAPRSLDEAIRILADAGPAAVPIAGGTDRMVIANATGEVPEVVVDLLRLPELQGVTLRPDGRLDIGAACTFSQLRSDPLVLEHLPIMTEVAATIGGWQIQNRATLGGNIANASPAGDSLPVLLALDAELVIAGPEGERVLPYADVHVDYRRTALADGELIVRVRIPVRPTDGVQLLRKVGTRQAVAISKVVVAGAARRVEGRLHAVRFAAGSVAAMPIRLHAVEEVCEGRGDEPDLAAAAAAAARDTVQPIDDVRSTATYRSFVLGRVVRRMVLTMLDGLA